MELTESQFKRLTDCRIELGELFDSLKIPSEKLSRIYHILGEIGHRSEGMSYRAGYHMGYNEGKAGKPIINL